MLGLRASEAVDVRLTDCRLPKENLLGALNQCFAIAREIVEGGRIAIAAQASASARRVSRRALPRPDRKQFGRPIAEFEASNGLVRTCRPRSTPRACSHSVPRRMRAKNPTIPD